ncbi:membrane protein [Acidothermaceae bacterium B102]|nr:membrane protein [Acidothermaceae bacterium B102]
MQNLLIVLVVLVLLAMYVTWTAGRLDRQHVRVEAGRSALDAALVRRAALAEELADLVRTSGSTDDRALAAPVVAAARTARDADVEGRERAENNLTRVLRPLVNALGGSLRAADEQGSDLPAGYAAQVHALLGQLASATSRIGLARNISNGAVDHTLALRRRRLVRWLHLAGRAAAPSYFEIDDTTLADALAQVARREP